VNVNGAVVLRHMYSAQGYRSRLETTTGTVLDEVKTTNTFGSPKREEFNGNAFATDRDYDTGTGRLLSVKTGTGTPVVTSPTVQDLEYTWRSNSTLLTRKDYKGTADDTLDTFTYDLLDRVITQQTSGAAARTLDFVYNPIGNVMRKLSSVAND